MTVFDVIVLDGITGSGKSTLFRRLEHSQWASGFESRLILGQAYTLRVASADEIVEHLVRLAGMIGDLARCFAGSEFARRSDGRGSMLVLTEGFHIYGLLEHVAEESRPAAQRQIEARLHGLPVRLISLEMNNDVIMERSVLSPLRLRSPRWRDFVFQHGATEEQICDYYTQRQVAHMKLISASSLPVSRIDTSAADWPRYEQQIIQQATEARADRECA